MYSLDLERAEGELGNLHPTRDRMHQGKVLKSKGSSEGVGEVTRFYCKKQGVGGTTKYRDPSWGL